MFQETKSENSLNYSIKTKKKTQNPTNAGKKRQYFPLTFPVSVFL